MDIKEFCEENGAEEVGFARVDYVTETGDSLPYAISLVVRLSETVIDEIGKEPTYTYFQHYRTVNAFIDQLTFKVGRKIQQMGYKYIAVPASQSIPGKEYSGIFSHKKAATLAGLGSIGKSALFLSYKYGPCVRLGTILTDMPLECEPHEYKDICGECNACIRACPAMAISGETYEIGKPRKNLVDAGACSKYMKEKFQHIGRGVVCGICIKSCPKKK